MKKVRSGESAHVSVAEVRKFEPGTRVKIDGVEAYISDHDPVNGYSLARRDTAKPLPGYFEECELVGKIDL